MSPSRRCAIGKETNFSSHVDVSKSVKLPSTDDRFGMYYVRMDNMKSGGSEIVPRRNAIIDTGLTNLMVPAEVSMAVHYP
jgi:hypothetical protein